LPTNYISLSPVLKTMQAWGFRLRLFEQIFIKNRVSDNKSG